MPPLPTTPDTFLGVLAHELRTPVTTIYAGATLLATHDLDEAHRRALATDIGVEADRLYRMVEDLVVLSRIEHRSLVAAREPVAISRMVAATIEREAVLHPDVRIGLLGAEDTAIEAGDPAFVAHALRNLLDNAIRYDEGKRRIDVLVDGTDDDVSVRIHDDSRPAQRSGREAFGFQAGRPATPAQAAGAGLGLLVARELLEAMGGRVWATVRDDGGSEFGFALPRRGS